jgi:hypothetical protein
MATPTIVFAVITVAALAAPAQTPPTGRELAMVRIAHAVMADGKPLSEGAYQLMLSDERPAPLAGQSPDAQRWVVFVADGKVVAREIAEVLDDSDLPPIGASARPTRDGVRVEMLQGAEFLRISVKRQGQRYLVHLPLIGE